MLGRVLADMDNYGLNFRQMLGVFEEERLSRLTVDKSPERVSVMFDSVSSCYDLMNDIMTGFSHRKTRRFALNLVHIESGQTALDLATGTGDFALLLCETPLETIVGVDFSLKMLASAKHKTKRRGVEERLCFVQGDILCLSFRNNTFDLCTVSFGIRNVIDIKR